MEFNEDGSLKIPIRTFKEEPIDKLLKHKWSEDDHLIAYFLSRFGNNSLGFSLKEISTKRDIPESSLKIQISAYKQFIGNSSFGQATELLYKTLMDNMNKSEKEILEKINKIV